MEKPPLRYTRSTAARAFDLTDAEQTTTTRTTMEEPSASSLFDGASASSQPSMPIVSDSAIFPPPFEGTSKENAEEWLAYFIRYANFKAFHGEQRRALFALLLRGPANTWFNTVQE